MNGELGVDLVVVSYKTPHLLRQFIEAAGEDVARAEGPLAVHLHIVVVSDEAGDLPRPASFRSITIDEHEPTGTGTGPTRDLFTNIGYNIAVNDAATGGVQPVIIACNADVLFLGPGSIIEHLAREITDHEDWGIVGPRQVRRDGPRDLFTYAGIDGTYQKPDDRLWGVVDDGQASTVRDVTIVAGSAFAIRRALWDELTACRKYRAVVPGATGAMLPTAHWFGDTYLSFHVAAHGYAPVYDGRVVCRHLGKKSPGSVARGMNHTLADSELYDRALEAHA